MPESVGFRLRFEGVQSFGEREAGIEQCGVGFDFLECRVL